MSKLIQINFIRLKKKIFYSKNFKLKYYHNYYKSKLMIVN